MQLTTQLLLRKPCKLFASVARVCQRQLGFLVEFAVIENLEFAAEISTPSVTVPEINISGFGGHNAIFGCR